MSFDITRPLVLSDGTPVEFVKTTSKGNTQVRLPDSHELAKEDPLRIFRPNGSHYQDSLYEQSGQPIRLANADPQAATDEPQAPPTRPDVSDLVRQASGLPEGSFSFSIGGFTISGSVTRS